MELREARCTNCGAHLNLEPQKTMATCDYCHSTIMVSNAVELALVEVDKTKDLERYRSLLKDAIQKNSIGEILRQARQIKNIIPSDFKANYYFAYAKQANNEPSFMKAFLTSDLPGTPEETIDVVNHIIHQSDLRDKPAIFSLLSRVSPESVGRYEEAHKNRARQENQYANVTRDVFVCHSSHDQAVAEKIVETLEKEGFTCWISTRNLRPEDSENYWVNITKAIENTILFLVVSSESAMLSKDVQREIEISQKRRQKRFEYKIDNTPQTVLFKHAFDGIKWVDGSESPLNNVKKLPTRVYEELSIPYSPHDEGKSTTSYKKPGRFKKLVLPLLIVALLGVSGIVFGISGILSPAEYTVEFIDYDNEVIETLILEEGSEIIYPNDPSRDGYTFSGWSSNPEIIEENLTLTAEYTQNIYNVVYQDYDGEVLKEAQVVEGESASPPSSPTRTGHSFSRWSASSESINEDTVIEAIYEINNYMVTFLDHNGNIVRRETVDFGQDANPPSVTREGHTFLGWNQSTENIQADMTLSPNYQIKTYTVTFKDYDGTVLDTLQVPYGSSAEAPNNPTREGYVFTGWNEPLSNITGDTDITAQYRDNFFEVTYKDHDGRIIQSFTVEYGKPSPTPSDPSREGYIFTGWNQTLNRVTEDADVFATYEEGTHYTVQFESDDSVIETETVRDGGLLAIPDVSKEGHTLDGWYTSVNGGETLDERWQFTSNTVQSNLTLYAKWSTNEYTITVRYNNNQNDLLITQDYGTEITIPEPNSKEGHTFTGWSKTIPNTMPGNNLTIDANWDINSYSINFYDNDKLISSENLKYNTDILFPDNVSKKGFKFLGWRIIGDDDLSNITKVPSNNLSFEALFGLNQIFELREDEYFQNIYIDSNNQYIFSGYNNGNLIIKAYDFEGNIIWSNDIPGYRSNEGYYKQSNMTENSNGDYLMVNVFAFEQIGPWPSFTKTYDDFSLFVKLDATGNTIISKQISRPINNINMKFIDEKTDYYHLFGDFSHHNEDYDNWIYYGKTDVIITRIIQWNHNIAESFTIGGRGDDYLIDMAYSNGSYFLIINSNSDENGFTHDSTRDDVSPHLVRLDRNFNVRDIINLQNYSESKISINELQIIDEKVILVGTSTSQNENSIVLVYEKDDVTITYHEETTDNSEIIKIIESANTESIYLLEKITSLGSDANRISYNLLEINDSGKIEKRGKIDLSEYFEFELNSYYIRDFHIDKFDINVFIIKHENSSYIIFD